MRAGFTQCTVVLTQTRKNSELLTGCRGLTGEIQVFEEIIRGELFGPLKSKSWKGLQPTPIQQYDCFLGDKARRRMGFTAHDLVDITDIPFCRRQLGKVLLCAGFRHLSVDGNQLQ